MSLRKKYFVLGGVVVFASAALIGMRISQGFTAQSNAKQAAIKSAEQRVSLKKLYEKRADFLKDWSGSFAAYGIASDKIGRLKKKVEDSRKLRLQTQDDFDQFDIVENQISNQFAEFIQTAEKNVTEAERTKFNSSLMEFERLELSLTRTRQAYHETAFEQRHLVNLANRSAGLFFDHVPLEPVFKAEEMLHEQQK